MPMRSQAQRRFLWATNPEMARRWEDHTPKGKKLPEKVSDAHKRGRKEAALYFSAKTAHTNESPQITESRLKIPRREFHGLNQLFNPSSGAKGFTDALPDEVDADTDTETPGTQSLLDETSAGWSTPDTYPTSDGTSLEGFG